MLIRIKSNEIEMRGGTRPDGSTWSIPEQTAYIVTEDEVKRIRLSLAKGQTPYAPNDYDISPESFVVDNFGSLKIGRLKLLPRTAAVRKAS